MKTYYFIKVTNSLRNIIKMLKRLYLKINKKAVELMKHNIKIRLL